jgi:predicted kinase
LVIVIAGPPCSGKSTIASHVAARLNLPHLSMDATRQRLLPGASHTRADREVAYRAMKMCAELLHKARASVILDAPYGHKEDRDAIAAVDPLWIECRVSPETAVRRLEARGFVPERPDLTPAIVRESAANWQYSEHALVLDTETLSVDQCVEAVLNANSPQEESPSPAPPRDRSR